MNTGVPYEVSNSVVARKSFAAPASDNNAHGEHLWTNSMMFPEDSHACVVLHGTFGEVADGTDTGVA